MSQQERISVLDPYYTEGVGRYELLSHEELCQLVHEMKMAEEPQARAKAREKIIQANLRLVLSIVGHRLKAGVRVEGMVGAGNTGLIRAVDKFKLEAGCKFSTYAVPWIKTEIAREIHKENSLVYQPEEAKYRRAKIEEAETRLRLGLGRWPTAAEISSDTGFGVAELGALAMADDIRSLDEDTVADDKTRDSFINYALHEDNHLELEKTVWRSDLASILEPILNDLDEKERRVIDMYYDPSGQRRSHQAIGEEMGVSSETVRRLHLKAIEKLRAHHNVTALEDYAA